VTVTDSYGHPLNNVTVQFTAPSSGASATLSNGGFANTHASGVASISATANGTAGNYNVTATLGGLTATFALGNETPGTPPSNVLATATSTTSVLVTWRATAGVTYSVKRVAAGNVTDTTTGFTTGSFNDVNANPNTAYLY